jgi:phospho-N-acetylmuramoyl-pentapeptide-transferase
MAAFLLSFLFVLIFEPMFIDRLKRRGIKGQPIREDGPRAHEGKRGTPTMGGAVIIAAVFVSTLLLADLSNKFVWLTLAVMGGFGAIGFLDDWRKIAHQNSKGLTGPTRLLWEGAIAAGVACGLIALGFSTELSMPFIKEWSFNLGMFLFVPFVVLVVVGTANAVNLTDGLDGLAIGPVMTVAATYAIFAYLGGHAVIAEYLGVPHIPGLGELAIILSAIAAAGLGFLWYNTFPAQVFMGDLGALGLGSGLGFIAILVKHEVVLVVAGGVFVLEALSVIMQRYYFKMTGKRIFRMAPLHHHFELKGWAEPKIIVRFWIVSIVLALISLTTLKLR